MDLSKLSDADVQALASGDMSKVSDAGLLMLSGGRRPGEGTPAPSLVVPDQGIGRSLVNGAGKFVSDVVNGTKQAWNAARGDTQANEEVARDQMRVEQGYAPLKRANPTSTAVGETLFPAVASIPFTGGASLPGVVGTGFLTSALPELLKYGEVGERLANALKYGVGGGIGAGAGYGVSRVLQPTSTATRLTQEAQDAASRLGYSLTAGEKQQSKMLQNIENWFGMTPGSAGRMAERTAANQSALNRAAAGAMGETADQLTEKTFANASGRIGSEFNRLSGLAAPDVGTPKFMQTLIDLESKNNAKGAFANPAVKEVIDKALDLASQNKLSGEAYQAIRSQLSADAAAATNNSTADALRTIRKALDEAANDSLSASDQAAYALARKQWQAFKSLTKGMVSEGGDVSGKRLAAALRADAPEAFRTGQMGVDQRLMDIAKLSEALKGVANPNSGQMAVTNAFMKNPVGALYLAGQNKALSAAIMNPLSQAYLGSNVLSPQLRAILQRTTVPLGISVSNAAQE